MLLLLLCTLRFQAYYSCIFVLGSPLSASVASILSAVMMVDTIYVRHRFRRHGIASAFITDVLNQFPSENIGFTEPLSMSFMEGSLNFVLCILLLFLNYLQFCTSFCCYYCFLYLACLMSALKDITFIES